MKIPQVYRPGRPAISFEFFPPKTQEAEEKLFETVAELRRLRPAFVSVTYGAMGTTRSNTLRIVSRIKSEIGIEAAAHLTCVGHTRDEIEVILGDLAAKGIENIVALRGDPPKGETTFKPVPNGFRYASELVEFIRKHPRYSSQFALAVAGYPEGHMECRDLALDLKHLKHKVDQGADAVVTQLFFENARYFEFVDRARKAGIKIPIVAGIMPVTHGPQIQKFASMCGASIPAEMQQAIEKFGEDQPSVENYGIDFAVRQCRELIQGGAPGIHFYTLNKSRAAQEIYRRLGLAGDRS